MTRSPWAPLLGILAVVSTSCGLADRFSGAAKAANELSAIALIQAIDQAQATYRLDHGQYSGSFEPLGSSLPIDLSGGKNGYRFQLRGSPGAFSIEATPALFGSTGSRSFYSDETMVVRENNGPEPATAASPDIQQRLGGK
jgi:type II secretory pathway pseudopilin PulG